MLCHFKISNLLSIKTFRILYFINLIIIILFLLFPIIENVFMFKKIMFRDIGLPLYGILLILSLSFCITFLLLNIWGIIINRRKVIYGIIIFILLIWIIWGIIHYFKGVFP
jgi:hypothetical protein